jgi:hypothetical protein
MTDYLGQESRPTCPLSVVAELFVSPVLPDRLNRDGCGMSILCRAEEIGCRFYPQIPTVYCEVRQIITFPINPSLDREVQKMTSPFIPVLVLPHCE